MDKAWAKQAIDALPGLGKAADAAREAGHGHIDAGVLAKHASTSATPPRPGSR